MSEQPSQLASMIAVVTNKSKEQSDANLPSSVKEEAAQAVLDQNEAFKRLTVTPPEETVKHRMETTLNVRRHRTGRNVQLNLKVTAEVQANFYAIADKLDLPLGAVLEKALASLEKEIG